MKRVFLQLTNRFLKLTPVKVSRGKNTYGVPATYELPEPLRDGRAFSDPDALAAFAASKIRRSRFTGKPVLFCLTGGPVVTKEYRHLPAKRAGLEKIARLEAETVLQDDVSGFVVESRVYGEAAVADGELKSILYAVPSGLISSLRRAFRKNKIRVPAYMPPMDGLMNSCRGLAVLQNGTCAVIDAGAEKIRMILFSGGHPVFQKEFDSVYEDLLQVLLSSAPVSPEEAEQVILRGGFLLKTGIDRFGEDAAEKISLLLDTAVGEVVRNLRVVLSSSRLELNRIFFCGALAFHPDFQQFVESLSPDTPFEFIGVSGDALLRSIALEKACANAGHAAADFFTLNGLLEKKKENRIDFSEREKRKGKERFFQLSTLSLLTLAFLCWVACVPWLSLQIQNQQRQDETLLSSPQYAVLQKLTDREAELKKEVSALKNDRDALPYRKSVSEETLAQLQTQVLQKVVAVQSCTIDNSFGTVSLEFTVNSLDSLNSLRSSVENGGFFTVLIPFSAAQGSDGGGYSCTVTLAVTDFENPVSFAASSAASSQEESSDTGEKEASSE